MAEMTVYFCLGTQTAAGAGDDAGEGQDVQAGLSAEKDAKLLPTSPPTYSREEAAALVERVSICK